LKVRIKVEERQIVVFNFNKLALCGAVDDAADACAGAFEFFGLLNDVGETLQDEFGLGGVPRVNDVLEHAHVHLRGDHLTGGHSAVDLYSELRLTFIFVSHQSVHVKDLIAVVCVKTLGDKFPEIIAGSSRSDVDHDRLENLANISECCFKRLFSIDLSQV